jgi:hypothetical protein
LAERVIPKKHVLDLIGDGNPFLEKIIRHKKAPISGFFATLQRLPDDSIRRYLIEKIDGVIPDGWVFPNEPFC